MSEARRIFKVASVNRPDFPGTVESRDTLLAFSDRGVQQDAFVCCLLIKLLGSGLWE